MDYTILLLIAAWAIIIGAVWWSARSVYHRQSVFYGALICAALLIALGVLMALPETAH
jgi:hypothetical protein